jgi:hypothetical protein
MKMKRIKAEKLRNEVWFQFYTEFKKLVEQFDPKALNIEELFAAFIVLYVKADNALEIIRKSATTEQIIEVNRLRGVILRGFSDAVKSALSHFDPTKRELARQLKIVLDHYGNIARMPYDEGTATIYNFIQEMKGAQANNVAALGLNDWITQLNTENQKFETLSKNRYTEKAGKIGVNMLEIRRETDKIYRNIVIRIEALILLNGEGPFLQFVKEMNTRIDHFNTLIEQLKVRKGRKGKEEIEEEEEEEEKKED